MHQALRAYIFGQPNQICDLLILGNTDYVFRLFPFVAGIASLLVMYKIASIFLDTTGKIVATGSFAISGKLVYYTSQAKQYSSDALISLLLLFVAYKCLESKIYKPRYIALIVSGVVSMWISHPSLFMLVGVSSGLALDQLIRPDRRRVNWLGITFLIWTVNFVILYFVSLRSLAANSALIDYWRNAFMPMPPWRGFAWILNAFPAMFENPVGLVGPLTASISMVVFLAGCISFFFKKRQLALFLIVPFPIVFLASGLQKYPFGDRLLLFIVPIVLLLIGEGIERIRLLLLKINAWLAIGVSLMTTGLLLYSPMNLAVQNLSHPDLGEHIKPVMVYIQWHKLDTDFVYVYYGAFAAFSYYAPTYGFEQKDYVIGVSSRQEPKKYIEDLDRLHTYGRVWFVFSHTCGCLVDEKTYFLEHLNNIGTNLDEFQAPGASVYLYSLDSVAR